MSPGATERSPTSEVESESTTLSAEAKLKSAMAALWARHLPTNTQRVEILERAATELLEAGAIGDELQTEAESAAHKLAGSLGTFGLDVGTERAREVETMLGGTRLDAERLSSSVLALLDLLDPSLDAPIERRVRQEEGQESPAPSGQQVGRRTDARPQPAVAETSGQPSPSKSDPSRLISADLAFLSDDATISERLRVAARQRLLSSITVPIEAGRVCHFDHDTAVVVDVVGAIEPHLHELRALAAANPDRLLVALAATDDFDSRLAVIRSGYRGLIRRDLSSRQMVAAIEMLRASRVKPEGLVVVVEPDPGADDSISAALASLEVEVSTVNRASNLLPVLVDRQPALVLVGDIGSNPSGPELCRVLRADPRWSALTILVAADLADRVKIGAVFAAGADDVVARPVDGMKLRGDVVARLRRLTMTSVDPANLVVATEPSRQVRGRQGPERPSRPEPNGPAPLLSRAGTPPCPQRPQPAEVAIADGARTAHEQRDPIEGTEEDPIGAADLSLVEGAEVVDDEVVDDEVVDDVIVVDVIVVDDDDVLADLLAFALESRSYRHHRFTDGLEAARSIGRGQVKGRLIVLDVGLPGMDGFSVLTSLGEDRILDSTPVMMLTARSGTDETLRALELGAADHVAKPFSVPVLMERIERMFGDSR